MSTKSHVDPDDSNGLSIGVEQTIKNTQSPDLRYHWSISSIILTVTIFHVYNRIVRRNSHWSSVNERQLLEVVGDIIEASQFASQACFGLQNLRGKSFGERRVIGLLARKLVSACYGTRPSSGEKSKPSGTEAKEQSTIDSDFKWTSEEIGMAVYGLQNLSGESMEEQSLIGAVKSCVMASKVNYESVNSD